MIETIACWIIGALVLLDVIALGYTVFKNRDALRWSEWFESNETK